MNLEKSFQDATAAFQDGDLDRAERLLEKIDHKASNQPAVLHLRGLIALRANKTKIAVKYLKQAVALSPTSDTLMALGGAYSQSGAFEDAIEVFGRAVKEAPSDATAVYNLGNALKNSGQPNEAIPHYQAATSIDPVFIDAYYNMGLALSELWKFSDAVSAYDRCLEINPNDVEAMKNRGNAL